MIEAVVEKLLGYEDPVHIPQKFAKWVGIYLETMSIDPQVCACVSDPQCASALDSMILELLELDDYEPRISIDDIKGIIELCRDHELAS
ncbi:MAG: hypothetical protein GXO32_03800 [Crenarchaeota archaeon]|nr:hypothetical protein [Thermoproteota archaeon]